MQLVPPELVFGLESSQPYVLRVRQNRLERANLSVGLRSAKSLEILGGVTEEDLLAIPANKMPDIGAIVRPQVRK